MTQRLPMLRSPLAPRTWIVLALFVGCLQGSTCQGQEQVKDSLASAEIAKDSTSTKPLNVEQLVSKVSKSVVTIRVTDRDGAESGIGTGFVIDDSGMIATNMHVIGQGRAFTITDYQGNKRSATAVYASDVTADLVIIQIDFADSPLPALPLADPDTAKQGMRVFAFGNPLGLEKSVVDGILSARREIEGQTLLQLAMPIEPGNSGGPLVDSQGAVLGIVNMKSLLDSNLGFAIPVQKLVELKNNPNSISIDRWVRLAEVDLETWEPLFGATWQQKGGRISASGSGNAFGGRSLLLQRSKQHAQPLEIAVQVRLDDEAGAAGIVFHSDGNDKHYGFYPSAGNLRLSCFRGASVFSWQVLHDVPSPYYLPGQWNQLKVRLKNDRITCFVNGHVVIESTDKQFKSGRIGLAKFRSTKPEFRKFEFGPSIADPELSQQASAVLDKLSTPEIAFENIGQEQLRLLADSDTLAAQELSRQAIRLKEQAERLEQLARDVRRSKTLQKLESLQDTPPSQRLLQGALLIAMLDHPDLDPQAYVQQINRMAAEINESLAKDAKTKTRRKTLHQYLFEQNGFHGSRSEYYHPANSHLNRVLDDREGLPILLSILYMELGKRIGLDVVGIGLPGNFVVRDQTDAKAPQLVDPFDRGKELSRRDAADIVLRFSGRLIQESDLEPQDVTAILTRVLNNLVGAAGRRNDGEAMLAYADALVAITPDDFQRRILRARLRGMTGRHHLAMEDFDWLLEQTLSPLEENDVLQLKESLQALIERAQP